MDNGIKEIKRVLAPLDGSPAAECTLYYIRTMAKGFQGLSADLIYVVEPVCLRFAGDMPQSDCVERLSGVREWANKYLAQKAEELRLDGIRARYIVQEGNPADIIIDYAADNNIDLIIMSTHGLSGFFRFTIGSVADKVTHYSKVPVLITSPTGCKAKEEQQKIAV